jgi:transcription-repair coupling factor (superfamily II helicase)
MQLQFVANSKSVFYQSQMFGKIINYATIAIQRAKLKEKNSKRFMSIKDVHSVEEACNLLEKISA